MAAASGIGKIKSLKFYETRSKQIADFHLLGIDFGAVAKKFLPLKEDYLSYSNRFPIFVVADGVTLEPGIGGYPRSSGAAAVARIFCASVVRNAEKSYPNFSSRSLREVFQKGNRAVKKYNDSRGRRRGKLNYWDSDLFAATAAAVIIKKNVLYWMSICDSFVALYSRSGKKKFQSSDTWPDRGRSLPANWNAKPFIERKKLLRRIYRNGVGKNGKLIGYGVVTGEPAAERYLNAGSIRLAKGARVLLGTDGFAPYLKLADFLKLFRVPGKNLAAAVKQFTSKKSAENPEVFGQERSLVSIWI